MVGAALHTKLYAALTTGGGLTALTALGVPAASVVADVRQGMALPYLILTPPREAESAVLRDKQARGHRLVCDLTAYAERGREARQITEAAYAALAAAKASGDLNPTGWRCADFGLDLATDAPGSGTPAQNGAYGRIASPYFEMTPTA